MGGDEGDPSRDFFTSTMRTSKADKGDSPLGGLNPIGLKAVRCSGLAPVKLVDSFLMNERPL
jgi:hypothetical protein